jgi:methionine synthase I (cobalamin-dependent)
LTSLVAGNLSPTWMYEPNSPSAADRVRQTFDEQLKVQRDEGVDFTCCGAVAMHVREMARVLGKRPAARHI